MGKGLKSAYELALERLAAKEPKGARGKGAPALTDAQKKEIAAVRAEYEAKLAECEILYRSRRKEAAGDPETRARLADEYRRDREFLTSARDSRIEALRSGQPPAG